MSFQRSADIFPILCTQQPHGYLEMKVGSNGWDDKMRMFQSFLGPFAVYMEPVVVSLS